MESMMKYCYSICLFSFICLAFSSCTGSRNNFYLMDSFFNSLCFAVRIVDSYSFSFPVCLGDVPALQPMRYITPDVIGNYAVSSIENALWSTLLPAVSNYFNIFIGSCNILISNMIWKDRQDAIAIFIAEGVSGFVGGVAAKGIAIIDGNKNNRESSLLSAG